MSHAPTCAHPGCVEPVVRTGSRGPWPNCCPEHRRERRREQIRARVRKHRGTQWVLARFESDRNADREAREYSIVGLELDRERPIIVRGRDASRRYPQDMEGRWLDEWATFWIEAQATAAPNWRAYVEHEGPK